MEDSFEILVYPSISSELPVPNLNNNDTLQSEDGLKSDNETSQQTITTANSEINDASLVKNHNWFVYNESISNLNTQKTEHEGANDQENLKSQNVKEDGDNEDDPDHVTESISGESFLDSIEFVNLCERLQTLQEGNLHLKENLTKNNEALKGQSDVILTTVLEKVETLVQENNSLKDSNEKQKLEIERLQKQISTTNCLNDAEDPNADLFNQNKNDLIQTKRQLSDRCNEIEQLQAEIIKLTSDLECERDKAEEETSKYLRENFQNIFLQERLAEKVKELDEQIAAFENVSRTLKEKDIFVQELEKTKKQIDDLEKKLEDTVNKNKILQDQFDEKSKELEEQKLEAEKILQDINEKNIYTEELTQKLKETETHLENEREKKQTEQSNELIKSGEELQKLQAVNAELLEQVTQKSIDLGHKDVLLAEATCSLQEKDDYIKQLLSEDEKNALVEKLSMELKEQYANTEELLDNWSRDVTSKEIELQQKQTQNSELARELEERSNKLRKVTEELQKCKRENVIFQERIVKKNDELSKTDFLKSESHQKWKDLKNEFQQVKQDFTGSLTKLMTDVEKYTKKQREFFFMDVLGNTIEAFIDNSQLLRHQFDTLNNGKEISNRKEKEYEIVTEYEDSINRVLLQIGEKQSVMQDVVKDFQDGFLKSFEELRLIKTRIFGISSLYFKDEESTSPLEDSMAAYKTLWTTSSK